MTMLNRFSLMLVVSLICALGWPDSGDEPKLRILVWNVEHLNEENGVGCLPRADADYEKIAQQVIDSQADIVAFQEVETRAAAERVFPSDEWTVEISTRPQIKDGPECWDREGFHLRHLATGFAVRKGIPYQRNEDLVELGSASRIARWGTDITLGNQDSARLRLLSVHLRTGCWGQGEDARGKDECTELRNQSKTLVTWLKKRAKEGIPHGVLGDFNRRLTLDGDWFWKTLNKATSSELVLLTQGEPNTCDPRYKDYIDHYVLDSKAAALWVSGSFAMIPRQGEHPDHCALQADFRL